jgi:beta-lactamase class A
VPDSVHQKLASIARRVHGNLGIAAIHLESGARVSLNGDRGFPMASVSKVPMALEFLRRVDAGEIDPSETIVVRRTDYRPGNSPIARWSGGRAVKLTVDSLFSLMLGVSDNSATDVILNMSGGPEEATRRVRELGIEGVTVDRSEARTFADLVGIPESVPESELYRVNYFRMRDALPTQHREEARERYGHDPKDTATPEGMAELLALIHEGMGLSEASHERLLDIMTSTRSGRRRLKGLLPPDVDVAHKTGTMAAAINDVGIIELPDGAGHLVLAAFVNTLHSTRWRRERTIAQAARVLYDYFSAEYGFRNLSPLAAATCRAETLGLAALLGSAETLGLAAPRTRLDVTATR